MSGQDMPGGGGFPGFPGMPGMSALYIYVHNYNVLESLNEWCWHVGCDLPAIPGRGRHSSNGTCIYDIVV